MEKSFTVTAPAVSRENKYIQSVKVNGQPYDKSYLTHDLILSGASVEFTMGATPGRFGINNRVILYFFFVLLFLN
jgi:Putative alpha-1,2-mannosidase